MESWLGVFKDNVEPQRVVNLDQLKNIVKNDEFGCVGTSHSYNGVQLYRGTPIDFRNSFLDQITYDEDDHTVTVEPSVYVRQLKEFLDTKNRQLYNSGNYMDQTVIGALMTGTHGYGDNAVMAESITEITFLDGDANEVVINQDHPHFKYIAVSFGVIQPIIKLRLKTKPITQCRIKSCMCSLSKIEFDGNIAFAVFPYSDKTDPAVAITSMEELTAWEEPTKRPKDWGVFESLKGCLIKYYWRFDRHFPACRKLVQRGIKLLQGSVQKDVITDPHDIDYLYDPYPLVEQDNKPIFSRKLMKPTHTSYNVAFFVPQDICKVVIRFIIDKGNSMGKFGFRNFIGVRNINTPSDLVFAGNYGGKVSAIDLYSNPEDAEFLWLIQEAVFRNFKDVKPHWGKSKLNPKIISEFKEDFEKLFDIRDEYMGDNSAVHPDLEKFLVS